MADVNYVNYINSEFLIYNDSKIATDNYVNMCHSKYNAIYYMWIFFMKSKLKQSKKIAMYN